MVLNLLKSNTEALRGNKEALKGNEEMLMGKEDAPKGGGGYEIAKGNEGTIKFEVMRMRSMDCNVRC